MIQFQVILKDLFHRDALSDSVYMVSAEAEANHTPALWQFKLLMRDWPNFQTPSGRNLEMCLNGIDGINLITRNRLNGQ